MIYFQDVNYLNLFWYHHIQHLLEILNMPFVLTVSKWRYSFNLLLNEKIVDWWYCIYLHIHISFKVVVILFEADELMLAMTFNHLAQEAFLKSESRDLGHSSQKTNPALLVLLSTLTKLQWKSGHCNDTKSFPSNYFIQVEELAIAQQPWGDFLFGSCMRLLIE